MAKIASQVAQEIWQELQLKTAQPKVNKAYQKKASVALKDLSPAEQKTKFKQYVINGSFKEALQLVELGVPLTTKVEGTPAYLTFLEYAERSTIDKMFEHIPSLAEFEPTKHDDMLYAVLGDGLTSESQKLAEFLFEKGIQPSASFYRAVLTERDFGDDDVVVWYFEEILPNYPTQYGKVSLEKILRANDGLETAFQMLTELSIDTSTYGKTLTFIKEKAPNVMSSFFTQAVKNAMWENAINELIDKKDIESVLRVLLEQQLYPSSQIMEENNRVPMSWPTYALLNDREYAYRFLMKAPSLQKMFQADVKKIDWSSFFEEIPNYALHDLDEAGFDFEKKDKYNNLFFHFLLSRDATSYGAFRPSSKIWSWMKDHAPLLLETQNRKKKTCFDVADRNFKINIPGQSKAMNASELKVTLERAQLAQNIQEAPRSATPKKRL